MLKKYYYFLAIPIFCLLFSSNVNAATSMVNATIQVASGTNLIVFTQSYTDILAEVLTTEGGNAGDTYVEFRPSYTVSISGMSNKYTSGYAIITVYVTKTISGALSTSFSGIEYTRPENSDGLNVTLVSFAENYFSIAVTFDNYYSSSDRADLGTYTLKYQAKFGDVTPLKGSFTTSITIANNNIQKYDSVINDRLTAILYSSIYQATGQSFQDIITILTNIRNQDPVYYAQIIAGLSSINQTLGVTNTNLLSILQEIDVDFTAVQTVLDLFPSYRTAVLQYWQDLLAMNSAQSSEAAEVESEYADKEAQSATLAAGLGQLVLPSVSANDFNVLNQVDSTQKANFFGLLSIITNNGFITTLLIIVVTGATVGYILYGKK